MRAAVAVLSTVSMGFEVTLAACATDWAWSSARAHTANADEAGLLDQALWRELAPLNDWADVLTTQLEQEDDWTRRFRAATYAGKPLGPQQFVETLESQTSFPLELRRRGRPPNKPDANAAAG